MTSVVNITADGLDGIRKFFEAQPAIAEKAARFAVNEAARFGRVQSSRQIASEVNLQKGYIDQRLTVTLSKSGEPAATITGRWRPTSLTRFLVSTPAKGKSLKVRVKAGGATRELKGAFPVRLRAGKGITDSKYNKGIAVRVPAGKQLRNSKAAKLLSQDKSGSVYLLYGPSINMVFRDVRFKVDDAIADRLQNEFLRQYRRLSGGQ